MLFKRAMLREGVKSIQDEKRNKDLKDGTCCVFLLRQRMAGAGACRAGILKACCHRFTVFSFFFSCISERISVVICALCCVDALCLLLSCINKGSAYGEPYKRQHHDDAG
jgi:hypothetical protein